MDKHYIISRISEEGVANPPAPRVATPTPSKVYHKTFDAAVEQAKRETNRFRTQGLDYNYGVYSLEAVTKVPVPEIEMIKVS